MRWKICGVLALSLSLGLSACQALEAGLVREETWQRVVLEDGEEAAEETAGANESGEEAAEKLPNLAISMTASCGRRPGRSAGPILRRGITAGR